MLSLQVIEEIQGEIAHCYDLTLGDAIYSHANHFWGLCAGRSFEFHIPVTTRDRLLGATRVTRRLTRRDKSNAVFNHQRDGVVVLYLGRIYFYDLAIGHLQKCADLKQCRNVLHGGIAVAEGLICFGEYGNNKDREAVPVWVSQDDGRSWSIGFEFPAGSIRHVHGVYTDPYSDSLWIPTGDFVSECYLYEVHDRDFLQLKQHGDGNQCWRPVSLLFDEDQLHWGMDSQLETSYIQKFDRLTGALEAGMALPGPNWYSKQFDDGSAALQTTVEIGPGSTSNSSHIFYSRDLCAWEEVARYRKDSLPLRYFKFGVIAFADGQQSSEDFLIFGEALESLDGRILRVKVQDA